jgi:hypothetical protein
MIPTEVTITWGLVIVTSVGIMLLWLFILASSDRHFRGDHVVVVVYIGV